MLFRSGLHAAVEFILETGVETFRRREEELTSQFLAGLQDIPNIRLAGPWTLENRAGVISVDFLEQDNAEAAFCLEQQFGILTRCGLHCAPAAHRTLGTFPQGTVRFSPGWYTSPEEVAAAIAAVQGIVSGMR